MKKDEIFKEIEKYVKLIEEERLRIASNKLEINERRSKLWLEAEGTVDAKKDYIKSELASNYDEIRLAEAGIEFDYNMKKLLEMKLEYCDG